jgi:hypothetical protein
MNIPRLGLGISLAALLSPVAMGQGWTLADAGIGILDDGQRPPRILERDRGEWFQDDLAAKLGGKRMFMFWIVGPRPETFRNRFGTAIYSYRFQESRQGEPARKSGAYSFSDEGWGTYQLNYAPGSYRVDVFLINRETQAESLVKSFSYRISPGKGTGAARPEVTATEQPHRPTQAGGPDVFLSDMPESRSGDIHGGLGKDRPYWTPELLIGGRRFAKGIVTCPGPSAARAFVEYPLNGRFTRFLATLGSAADQGNYGKGTMNYFILVDGKIVEQGRFPTPPATREISVSVQGGQTLRLEVDNGGDGHSADHAAWGDARLKR